MTVSHYAGPKSEQISDQFRKHVYNSLEYILDANAVELRPEIPPNLNVDCMTGGMVMGGDSGMRDHGVSYIPQNSGILRTGIQIYIIRVKNWTAIVKTMNAEAHRRDN